MAELRGATPEQVLRSYARYQQGASGLSHVLGGVLVLGGFFAPAVLGQGGAAWVALLAPICWLLSRESIRRKLYGAHGAQDVGATRFEQSIRLVSTLALIVISGMVIVAALNLQWPSEVSLVRKALFVGIVGAIPFAYWFGRWSAADTWIGLMLLALAAIVGNGGSYLAEGHLYMPILGVAAVAIGLYEHRQYPSVLAAMERTLRA